MKPTISMSRQPLFVFSAFIVPAAVITFLSLPVLYKSHVFKYYTQLKQRTYNKFASTYLELPIPLSYVSKQNLEQKLAHPAAWAVEQIDRDFANYNDASKQNVLATYEAFPANKWVVMFTIKDGKLTVQRKDYELNGAQTRGL